MGAGTAHRIDTARAGAFVMKVATDALGTALVRGPLRDGKRCGEGRTLRSGSDVTAR